MTFKLVDEMLTRHAAGDVRSPAAEHLDMRLVQFARGVAVYEMPVRLEICNPGGVVENGVLVALAETAMTAAATTMVPDADEQGKLGVMTRDLCAHFHSPVPLNDARMLRAEAIVVSTDGDMVRVEADVLADGHRVASFDANSQAL